MGGLEAHHRRFRERTITTVDRARRVTDLSQPTLQHTHTSGTVSGITRAWIQDNRRPVQSSARHRTGDPIDLQTMGGLEAHHRRFRERTITTVDRARRVTDLSQPTLQHTHTSGTVSGITRAWIQDNRRPVQSSARHRTGDPIDLQTMGGLEAHHRRFRERTITTVDRARRVTDLSQSTLQHTHTRRAGPAGVAAPHRQHDSASVSDRC